MRTGTTVFVSSAQEPWGAENSLRLLLQSRHSDEPEAKTLVLCLSDSIAEFFASSGSRVVRVACGKSPRVSGLLNIQRILKKDYSDCRVVIFSLQLMPLIAALKLSKKFHGEVVVDLHDAPKGLLDRVAVGTLIRFADYTIAVSEHVLTHLHLKSGEKCTVIRRPIAADKAHSEDENRELTKRTTRVGVVGRVDREKRVDLIIRAISRLPDSVTLDVYGDPLVSGEQYLKDLHQLAEDEAPGKVVFHGTTNNALIYESIDVLVCANANEPLGRTVGEAMLSGVPVVVPDRGGASELVEDGVTGLKFRSGSVSSLASRLEFCHRRQSDLRTIVALAREMAFGAFNERSIARSYFRALGGDRD